MKKKKSKGRGRTHVLMYQSLNAHAFSTRVAVSSDNIMKTNKYKINKVIGSERLHSPISNRLLRRICFANLQNKKRHWFKGTLSPSLDLANSVVALVLAKSSCMIRYESNKVNRFKHGNTWFWHHGGHTMVQTCISTSQKHVSNVSFDQSTIKTKI